MIFFIFLPVEFFIKVFQNIPFDNLQKLIRTPELASKLISFHTQELLNFILKSKSLHFISIFLEKANIQISFELQFIFQKIAYAVVSENPTEKLNGFIALRKLLTLLFWELPDKTIFDSMFTNIQYSLESPNNELKSLQLEILFIAFQKNFLEKENLLQIIHFDIESTELNILVVIGFYFLKSQIHLEIIIPFLIDAFSKLKIKMSI